MVNLGLPMLIPNIVILLLLFKKKRLKQYYSEECFLKLNGVLIRLCLELLDGSIYIRLAFTPYNLKPEPRRRPG